jgi:hypothetical protein
MGLARIAAAPMVAADAEHRDEHRRSARDTARRNGHGVAMPRHRQGK